MGRKKASDSTVWLLTVALIGAKVAPVGTVAMSCVAVAAVMVALVLAQVDVGLSCYYVVSSDSYYGAGVVFGN